MIAERAGLSPGGVFTTFEDKVAILSQIVGEQRERLFELAHADEFPRLRMVAAYIGASYGWSRTLEEEHRRLHRRLAAVIGAILRDGVERAEIGHHVDLDLLLEVISSVYLRNFRTAYYAGFDEAAMNARASRQLDLIFDGARPK
jgi:AcrR family transcriptional regulator